MYSDDQKGEGYPWLYFSVRRSWVINLIVTLLVFGSSGAFYVWYSRFSNDVSPDSIAGYAYALVGTTFMILAAVLFSRQRRSRNKRAIGKLNASLNWHISLGVMALALLLMHSFGNLNPRSGTYALYGLIALSVSGGVGRILDRFIPRVIANEVDTALTSQGDDRIEHISQELQAIVVHHTQKLHDNTATPFQPSPSFSPVALPGAGVPGGQSRSPHTSWDQAYFSLEAMPQEVSREAFVCGNNRAPARSDDLIPGAEERIAQLQKMQRAMQNEQYYCFILRCWRVVHVSLVFLTLGLTIWHLVYAAQLLLPTLFH